MFPDFLKLYGWVTVTGGDAFGVGVSNGDGVAVLRVITVGVAIGVGVAFGGLLTSSINWSMVKVGTK